MQVSLLAGGLCGAIPTVGPIISGVAMIIWGIFAGYGMLAINHLRYIKSGGREQGGGLWGGALLLIFGIIVIPILTVWVTNHIRPLAEKVLGVTFQ